MEIVNAPAPTGKPVMDTTALQTLIDQAFQSKRPTRILLQAGDYHLGYAEDSSSGKRIRGENYPYQGNHKLRGLYLPTMDLETLQGENGDETFLELQGSHNGTTRFVRMGMPVSPLPLKGVMKFVNNHFLKILQAAENDVPPSQFPDYYGRLKDMAVSEERSNFAIMLRKMWTLPSVDKPPFDLKQAKSAIAALLEIEEEFTQWLFFRKVFSWFRMVNTVDTAGTATNRKGYTNATDSAWIKLSHIEFDGQSDELLQRGWRTDNYQLEHAASMMVYANHLTPGRVRVALDQCSFINSPADGFHMYANAEAKITSSTSKGNARGGITMTGRHAILDLQDYEGFTDSATSDGVSVEIEAKGYSSEVKVNIENLKARRVKFTLLPGGTVHANNMEVMGYYSQASYQSTLTITNSKFFTSPNLDTPFILNFPGTTLYRDCIFSMIDGSIEAEREAPLISIGSRRDGFGYQNQRLEFVDCSFINHWQRRNNVACNAIHRHTDPAGSHNLVRTINCSFAGPFHHVFAIIGGQNEIINCNFDHPDQSGTKRNLIYYFSSEDYNSSCRIMGDYTESKLGHLRPFLRVAASSANGSVRLAGTKIKESENLIIFQSALDPAFSLTGGRLILPSLPSMTDATGVDGIVGDVLEIIDSNGIGHQWRCTQSGDAGSVTPVWEQVY